MKLLTESERIIKRKEVQLQFEKDMNELQFRHTKVINMTFNELRIAVVWLGKKHAEWFDKKTGCTRIKQ